MMRSRAGMTLVELMIGLVITTLVVTAGYAAFATIIDRRAEAQRVVTTVGRAAAIRRALVAWLQDGQPQISSGGVPRNGLQLGGEDANGELRFVTTASTPFATDSTTVFLFINTSDTLPQHGLVAQFTRNGGVDSLRVQIDSAITGLRVDYLTESGTGTAVERLWVTADEMAGTSSNRRVGGGGANTGAIPIAIRLTLSANDSTQLQPLLRVPIVLPLRRGS
jgi:prepilin-type N-terminal cleavage/methylation domain-containing protein